MFGLSKGYSGADDAARLVHVLHCVLGAMAPTCGSTTSRPAPTLQTCRPGRWAVCGSRLSRLISAAIGPTCSLACSGGSPHALQPGLSGRAPRLRLRSPAFGLPRGDIAHGSALPSALTVNCCGLCRVLLPRLCRLLLVAGCVVVIVVATRPGSMAVRFDGSPTPRGHDKLDPLKTGYRGYRWNRPQRHVSRRRTCS